MQFNAIQELINSITEDKNTIHNIHSLSRQKKVKQIQVLKQKNSKLVGKVNNLKTRQLEIQSDRQRLLNEIRTQEHYNNILMNDKNTLLAKISDEAKKKFEAAKKLKAIKEQVLNTSKDYEKHLDIMKQKQLFNAKCQTDKLSLEKHLNDHQNAVNDILSRIKSENEKQKFLLNEIAELHENCLRLQSTKMHSHDELKALKLQNQQTNLQLTNERKQFEVLKKNAEITRNIIEQEKLIAFQHSNKLSNLKHLQEQVLHDTSATKTRIQVNKTFSINTASSNENNQTISFPKNTYTDSVGKENAMYLSKAEENALKPISTNTPHRYHRKSKKTTTSSTVSIKKRRNKTSDKKAITQYPAVDKIIHIRENHSKRNNRSRPRNKKKRSGKKRRVNILGLFEEL